MSTPKSLKIRPLLHEGQDLSPVRFKSPQQSEFWCLSRVSNLHNHGIKDWEMTSQRLRWEALYLQNLNIYLYNSIKSTYLKLSMVVHTSNPSSWEEDGGSGVQAQFEPQTRMLTGGCCHWALDYRPSIEKMRTSQGDIRCLGNFHLWILLTGFQDQNCLHWVQENNTKPKTFNPLKEPALSSYLRGRQSFKNQPDVCF